MTQADNEYHETEVKHILLSRFNDIYNTLDDREKPKIDLFDYTQNIGVEITISSLCDDEIKLYELGLRGQQAISKNYNYNLYKTRSFSVKSKIYDESENGWTNFALDVFKYSFEKKNNHHKSHYNNYSKTDLFIHDLLYRHILINKQIFMNKILEYFNTYNKIIRFRYVYFEIFTGNNCTIFMFDVNNNLCKYIDISNYEMNIIGLYTKYEQYIKDLQLK